MGKPAYTGLSVLPFFCERRSVQVGGLTDNMKSVRFHQVPSVAVTVDDPLQGQMYRLYSGAGG